MGVKTEILGELQCDVKAPRLSSLEHQIKICQIGSDVAIWRLVLQSFMRWQWDTLLDNIRGLDVVLLPNFESEAVGFIRKPTRTRIKKLVIVKNVVQNQITGGRFKTVVDEIKGIRSIGTEKILVLEGRRKRRSSLNRSRMAGSSGERSFSRRNSEYACLAQRARR
jgi:hypothetical protein